MIYPALRFQIMFQNVWPKDNPALRKRVVLALSLLVGAKLLGISIPFFFKHAIDSLNEVTGNRLNVDNPENTVATFAIALLVRNYL